MSCIKLTGSPARLSHKMHAYAVASLCGASRAIQSGDTWRWAALMNDAARFFGAAAHGALIDPCAKYTHRFGGMPHTRQSDRLEVVGSAE